MLKRLAGTGISMWLKTVYGTSSFKTEPEDLYAEVRDVFPLIIAMWHGDAFMAPFMKPAGHEFSVMVSRHGDGDIIATTLEALGTRTIRGAGGKPKDIHRKGGAQALRRMIQTLESGSSVGMTADVPKVARRAGPGIVMLARLSGRPVVPVAVATSRMFRLNTWDEMAICLPFSRGAFVVGSPIWIPREGGDAEEHRLAIETALNRVHARAAEMVAR